jgi:hypothetical protein
MRQMMKRTVAVAGLLAASTTAVHAEAAWMHESGESEMLYQDGGNTIKDEYATKDVTPRLEFHCNPGDPAVTARIDWHRFISSFSTEVGFKVDDGKFTWLKWKVDGSEKVTLSPSPDDTQKLIDAMASGSQLLVDVTPYSEGPVTVTYELAGFADALETLKAACQ